MGVGGALLVVLVVAGCDTSTSYDAEQSAPTSTVSSAQARSAARTVVRNEPDSYLAQGLGNSMQPVYGNNTTFLITPIAWDDLRAGMNVAYRDPFGDQIVHTLLYERDGSWVVQGVNNDAPDKYHVTRQNLIGVVYGSFQSDQPAQTP
jgi:phage repressor protein C with HTH and peptisase S24 domain